MIWHKFGQVIPVQRATSSSFESARSAASRMHAPQHLVAWKRGVPHVPQNDVPNGNRANTVPKALRHKADDDRQRALRRGVLPKKHQACTRLHTVWDQRLVMGASWAFHAMGGVLYARGWAFYARGGVLMRGVVTMRGAGVMRETGAMRRPCYARSLKLSALFSKMLPYFSAYVENRAENHSASHCATATTKQPGARGIAPSKT